MLSNFEYQESGGSKCPKCLSDNILGGPIHVVGRGAIQTIFCNACGASWTDVYQLAGYDNFED